MLEGRIEVVSESLGRTTDRIDCLLYTSEPAFAPARLVGLAVKPACTLAFKRTVADRPERTFARLRYPLGGDRPSQTARLARSDVYKRQVRGR